MRDPNRREPREVNAHWFAKITPVYVSVLTASILFDGWLYRNLAWMLANPVSSGFALGVGATAIMVYGGIWFGATRRIMISEAGVEFTVGFRSQLVRWGDLVVPTSHPWLASFGWPFESSGPRVPGKPWQFGVSTAQARAIFDHLGKPLP